MGKISEPMVWIDLEMTGLNLQQDTIIEIATIVTDGNLNIIAEGPNLAIHQPESVMSQMVEWCQIHHARSGLTQRVKESKISLSDAEQKTLSFLQEHVAKGVAPLCGNSICTDRRFLAQYMPILESYLHYRMVDVSSIKELAKRWAPSVANGVKKSEQHLALADIKESISELRYYREHFFLLSE